MPAFELWMEVEIGEPLDQEANRPERNFCNISVKFDGKRYALNIWTFDFLPLARRGWPYDEESTETLATYLLPPDLFVERLDRPTVEAVISDLLANNLMDSQWLCDDEAES